jgi:hypothetical protein
MALKDHILQTLVLLAFWAPFGIMAYFCSWLMRKNIGKLSASELSSTERSITKFRIAVMTLPLLAFSCGFLFFTIRIVLVILGY